MTTPSRGSGRIGVLVPFTNTNLEPDMALLRPPGVSMHFARLGGYDLDAIPDAGQMAGQTAGYERTGWAGNRARNKTG